MEKKSTDGKIIPLEGNIWALFLHLDLITSISIDVQLTIITSDYKVLVLSKKGK